MDTDKKTCSFFIDDAEVPCEDFAISMCKTKAYDDGEEDSMHCNVEHCVSDGKTMSRKGCSYNVGGKRNYNHEYSGSYSVAKVVKTIFEKAVAVSKLNKLLCNSKK